MKSFTHHKKTAFALAALAALGLWFGYNGLPPYSAGSSYPEPVSEELNARIELRMEEIKQAYPDKNAAAEVRKLSRRPWDRVAMYSLIDRGPEALSLLPYIEAKTRDSDPIQRHRAYGMLSAINAGLVQHKASDTGRENVGQIWLYYVMPIWQRSLKDASPDNRAAALMNLSNKSARDQILWQVWGMMRDPDKGVRYRAAKTLSAHYDRGWLVPLKMRLEVDRWEH